MSLRTSWLGAAGTSCALAPIDELFDDDRVQGRGLARAPRPLRLHRSALPVPWSTRGDRGRLSRAGPPALLRWRRTPAGTPQGLVSALGMRATRARS